MTHRDTRISILATALALVLAGCLEEATPTADASTRADATTSDGGAHTSGDASLRDASSDAPHTTTSCFSPTQNVDSAYQAGSHGCPCTAKDVDQCIRGVALVCHEGQWEAVEDGPCLPRSADACRAAGGEVVWDPGDGSSYEQGCPDGRAQLGVVGGGGGGEGGLCCDAMRAACVSQDVHVEGDCDGGDLGVFYVQGLCIQLSGCACAGDDCDQAFASVEACQTAYQHCKDQIQPCGGWYSGTPCPDDQYCAYRGLGLCGAADGSAICEPRPDACDDVYDPVCGCDNQTYANACTAAMAGSGIAAFEACGG